MKNLLSHRVFPICPRMLYDLWDYGSLDPVTEQKYIEAMIQQLNLKESYSKCFVKSVLYCQKYIKETVEKQQSSVSLRDIKRVVRIFRFYYIFILFRESFTKENQNDEEKHAFFHQFYKSRQNTSFESIQEIHFIRAFVITILLNYVFRIGKQGERFFSIILIF